MGSTYISAISHVLIKVQANPSVEMNRKLRCGAVSNQLYVNAILHSLPPHSILFRLRDTIFLFFP
jgi:hypothetical protein